MTDYIDFDTNDSIIKMMIGNGNRNEYYWLLFYVKKKIRLIRANGLYSNQMALCNDSVFSRIVDAIIMLKNSKYALY